MKYEYIAILDLITVMTNAMTTAPDPDAAASGPDAAAKTKGQKH